MAVSSYDRNNTYVLGENGSTSGVKITSTSVGSKKRLDVNAPLGLAGGGVHGNLALTTANTAYEAKVGGSRLGNRKNLTIVALDNDMYWGYSNSVTTSTGFPLYKNQVAIFDTDPDAATPMQVWLVCASASKNARITESL